jgi:energy coupling factor transporter S component ThiW
VFDLKRSRCHLEAAFLFVPEHGFFQSGSFRHLPPNVSMILCINQVHKSGDRIMQSRDVSKAVILIAMAVALSPFFIPVGISKCFPAQHMINVIAAVMLGPVYAVAIALAAAIIRNILGLGTLLAFPGGMIGALLAGLFYKSTRNIYIAGLGEIFGTGVLGSLAAVYIIGPMLLGKTMAVGALMIAFSVSTIGGSVIGIVALHLLQKGGVWQPVSK